MFEDTTRNLFNNKYELTTEFHSGRMSHWINTFSIKDLQTNELVIDLIGSSWDLGGAKEEGDLLMLTIKRYPHGNVAYKATLNLDQRVFEYEGTEYPITQFKRVLNKASS